MAQKTPSAEQGLTSARLREVLDYDPDTGLFRWRITLPGRGGNVREGKIAGSLDTKGKRQIRIDGYMYFAHRLAFLWMLGRWPIGEVDHRDRDAANNVWENLREVSGSQNSMNRIYTRDLPTGVYRTAYGRFYAAIEIEGRLRYLGIFPTPEEAHAAFVAVAREERGDFLPIELQ
jgi:hypothetical protein